MIIITPHISRICEQLPTCLKKRPSTEALCQNISESSPFGVQKNTRKNLALSLLIAIFAIEDLWFYHNLNANE